VGVFLSGKFLLNTKPSQAEAEPRLPAYY